MGSCMEDWNSVVFCLDLGGFFPSALQEIPKEPLSCQRAVTAVVLHKMQYKMCRMQGCCCAGVVLGARLTVVLPGLRWEPSAPITLTGPKHPGTPAKSPDSNHQ